MDTIIPDLAFPTEKGKLIWYVFGKICIKNTDIYQKPVRKFPDGFFVSIG